jgi:hypothetical protein
VTGELQRLAAMHLLMSGHIDQGIEVARTILAGLRMTFPASPTRALIALLFRRAQLWLRGHRYRERPAEQIPLAQLQQIDISLSLAMGLSMVEPIRGAYFQATGLLQALRAGEPHRIARSLTLEAWQTATAGPAAKLRTARLLSSAELLAQQVGSQETIGLVSLVHGTSAHLEGRWRDGVLSCQSAETTFRDHYTGAYWHLASAQACRLWCMGMMGQFQELALLCSTFLEEARKRGDRQSVASLCSFTRPLIRMVADQVVEGEEELHGFVQEWSRAGFHIHHGNCVHRFAEFALYRGDSAAAWAHIIDLTVKGSRSLLNRVQHFRLSTFDLRGRCCLAQAKSGKDPNRHLHLAEQDAHRLEREKRSDTRAMALLIRAGVAFARGNLDGAILVLHEAARQFEACDMLAHAAAARRRLGQLLGGDRGQELIAQADAWMTAQQVRNPARLTAMLAPGFPD